jgi:hypothetical protein
VQVLGFIQVAFTTLFIIKNNTKNIWQDLISLKAKLNISFSQYNNLSKLAIILPLASSFLLTLVPPFEAFDALLYHLTQPATILRDGGLRAVDNFPFWFPNITENVYLWALALGSERAAQIMHFAWGTLTALLLWHWSVKIWGIEIGRKTLLLLAAIPSLPMLASWAYADMALSYYAVAAMYALNFYRQSKGSSWLYVTAVCSGMAMGVKYTSFVVPLTCGIVILFQRPFSKAFWSASQFSFVALPVALPWYLRNAIVMGNPFYPFVFGGRYWDSFLASWYADTGSGIGWNVLQIFLLPLNLILGHRDATFFDGRFGPLFLILLPLTIGILISRAPRDLSQKLSLSSIGIFTSISFAAWTLGVINSSGLWQARLLFPAVLAFTLPTALGWDSLTKINIPKLNIGFMVNVLIIIIITLTIFENTIFVLQRNPLAVAFGLQTRDQYIERVAPSYYDLMQNMDELPADSYVYFLFEPRSYDMPRNIQPDTLVTNFAHDLHLYHTVDDIIQNWKSKGYTHIVVYERGVDFMYSSGLRTEDIVRQDVLAETRTKLIFVNQTPDGMYTIYEIP